MRPGINEPAPQGEAGQKRSGMLTADSDHIRRVGQKWPR